VGLGGRLDATNVIDRPGAPLTQTVSNDHAEFLGNTVARIPADKAGVLKRDVVAVGAPQSDEGWQVNERQAARVGAPLKVAGQDWTVMSERNRLVYQDQDGLLDLPAPKLFGRHQLDNAGAAIATLRAVAPTRLRVGAVEAGVVNATWPARMQRITQGALLRLVPEGSEVWLDGAHNVDGGRAIAAALADLEERVSRPLVLVVGMLATKDF